jgi:pentatricopeptide repeat protein
MQMYPPIKDIVIDGMLSRYVDDWFPTHPTVTLQEAYRRLQDGIASGKYVHPSTLGRLINGSGRVGDLEKVHSCYDIAQIVLHSIENKQWQSQAWFQIEDQMIIACAHAGDMDAAFQHRDRIASNGGIPSADAYGSLVECVKDTTDDTSNAMALFSEAQMLGCTPNVYLYNTIISKLAKARKADFALELFQQMKAMPGVRPSSITYGAVIAACARVGDAQSAEQLFLEMSSQPNFRPRIPPYNMMMQLYTHTKPDRERVLHYYDQLLLAGVKPSAHTYKVSYTFTSLAIF